ncbi:hypothetical protein BS78_K278400 [Paspalum vaginatum]|uniref:GRF-type domain-containing protein n=1 Tax=Paspalum vaginatum TaxID=158149 RepID=A0A9W8CG41_9POAL|nr:hypothetical protein BS78_K278400 [Paspalum vaginatum]
MVSSPGNRTTPPANEEYLSSPIPYREGPLDYQPVVLCHCNHKAAKWISWSDDNPGRRYYKCFYAWSGGCGFWRWIDSANYTTVFLKQLLKDLRDAVRGLRRKNKDLAADLDQEGSKLAEHMAAVVGLKKVVTQKYAEIADLTAQVHKLRKERSINRLLFVMLVATAVGVMLRM